MAITTAAAHYRQEFSAVERKRALAPNSVKLEALLWAFAEAHATATFERVATIAGRITECANRGHDVTTSEALACIEAAFREVGVRL